MSPGHTFERVYAALKAQIVEGRYPPGAHLEPRVLTDELTSSITPIRDALHRLVGERLLEAPRNDGFRIPTVTEFRLRELYGWQSDLLRLAIPRLAPRERPQAEASAGRSGPTPGSATELFLQVAQRLVDDELKAALTSVCERLAPLRGLEERFIPDVAQELQTLARLLDRRDAAQFRRAISAWHRRRDRAVPELVAALHRPTDHG